ncbi:MAG: hypothetical protein R8G01_08510 [Ilumatobacteraceae bacterium]|nr:hypothetical protein [Ilumatobacteraceae bacterium]
MVFGDRVAAANSGAPAAWIRSACRGAEFTVGALVPNAYPSVLRVQAPPGSDRFWSSYRELFATIASVGERHTSSPDRAWFAIWEGHGFDSSTRHIAHPGPLDDEARLQLEQERARLRAKDDRRNSSIRAELTTVPRFTMPYRTYHLVTGPVSAVTHLRNPAEPDAWQRPELFWPDDRRWFVATDVDFWSLYVGGEHEFISDLVGAVATPSEVVTLDLALEPED